MFRSVLRPISGGRGAGTSRKRRSGRPIPGAGRPRASRPRCGGWRPAPGAAPRRGPARPRPPRVARDRPGPPPGTARRRAARSPPGRGWRAAHPPGTRPRPGCRAGPPAGAVAVARLPIEQLARVARVRSPDRVAGVFARDQVERVEFAVRVGHQLAPACASIGCPSGGPPDRGSSRSRTPLPAAARRSAAGTSGTRVGGRRRRRLARRARPAAPPAVAAATAPRRSPRPRPAAVRRARGHPAVRGPAGATARSSCTRASAGRPPSLADRRPPPPGVRSHRPGGRARWPVRPSRLVVDTVTERGRQAHAPEPARRGRRFRYSSSHPLPVAERDDRRRPARPSCRARRDRTRTSVAGICARRARAAARSPLRAWVAAAIMVTNCSATRRPVQDDRNAGSRAARILDNARPVRSKRSDT